MRLFKQILYIFCCAVTLVSCREKDIIPKDTMSRIYYDMYMIEFKVDADFRLNRYTDSLHLYESIFQRYGYTQEDYQRSLDYYMVRPDKFEKVFAKTKTLLEIRKARLEKQLAKEEKRFRGWKFVDSLELFTADTIQRNECYRTLRILFFKPDTLVPDSPAADSAFMERPQSPFMIFRDTAGYVFRTYESKAIPRTIRVPDKEEAEKREKGKDSQDEKEKFKRLVRDGKGIKRGE